ncbi:vitamin K epoxide reductase family protein [Kineococcus sp. SYSU DK005]|uniref:vitamin K epoxide reductase family protein n=1 Tax=Kineococcus sp. SYSU DK005 TaxID=3383126 RepID=UPI003D7C5C4C
MPGTTAAAQHQGGERDERPPAAPAAGPGERGEPGGPGAAGERHLSHLPVRPRARGLLLALGGAVGFLASMVLTVERFRLATEPGYRPSCSVNPFISCQTVMESAQAALFGFPNPLLGIGAFAVSGTLGVLLLSGTALPRRVERGYLLGITLGAVFVAWLVVQALFSIHALCPYCMVVWAVVVPTFWVSLADALDRGLLPVPRALRGAARAVVDFRVLLVVLTLAAIAAAVGVQFWSYWVTLL